MAGTLKDRIREALFARFDFSAFDNMRDQDKLRCAIRQVLDSIVSRPRGSLTEEDKQRIIGEMLDEFSGLGPIEEFMKDPTVTEIMINGPKKVYVERHGKKQLVKAAFDNEQQLMYMVQKILGVTRRRVDESYPYTDVSLKDGSRVNIIIPPLALDGPTVTIRKFLKEIKKVEDLVALGTMDQRMADFLVACIKAKVNIMFAGATGSGKTTTVGVLSSYIGHDERIITIEDTAELHLAQEHVVRLETKQPNIEGKGEISIRDLFKNSLRMRPQRLILGEMRSGEALDMLQAMCSGHRGALSVIHANSPQEVLYRLETMILTSGIHLSLEAIHRQIASSLNLIVQQEQLIDGSRKITHITQVNGIKDGQASLEDIFIYDIEKVSAEGSISGRWKSTGIEPVFYPLFRKVGLDISHDQFRRE